MVVNVVKEVERKEGTLGKRGYKGVKAKLTIFL